MDSPYRMIPYQGCALAPRRALHIDIIGALADVRDRFGVLRARLQRALASGEAIETVADAPSPFARAGGRSTEDKLAELGGRPGRFRYAQLDAAAGGAETVAALEGIVPYYGASGLQLVEPGLLRIDGFGDVRYDATGRVVASPLPSLSACNVLQLAAAFIEQDFGVVIERGAQMVYLFDCSRFEKTPKNVDTGENTFIGEDFFEWHHRIPGFGPFLAGTFRDLDQAFRRRLVDLLWVELRGRNLYTDGEHVVQRYERDYVVPLWSQRDEYVGLGVFADVFFKSQSDEQRPWNGGQHLYVDSPADFHQRFQVIKHAAFKPHPGGIRPADAGQV
ncbi:MAG: hypothetical protein ACXVDD_00040 [Polyangia bacterium]